MRRQLQRACRRQQRGNLFTPLGSLTLTEPRPPPDAPPDIRQVPNLQRRRPRRFREVRPSGLVLLLQPSASTGRAETSSVETLGGHIMSSFRSGEEGPWQRVRDLFIQQQMAGAFPGGQLVVRQGGAVVVDVAAGVARGLRTGEEPPVPVTADTRFQVMSASKPVIAIIIAMLEERGLLDVDAPIAEYWPAFAAHGKHAITPHDVLTHRSGLLTPDIDARPERWSDWTSLTAALADVRPTYPRGTQAYNPLAYGWILGEL
ncbi:MAG TPA: serine hydrolase domain-containing protein, partial [Polyangia bacterium]